MTSSVHVDSVFRTIAMFSGLFWWCSIRPRVRRRRPNYVSAFPVRVPGVMQLRHNDAKQRKKPRRQNESFRPNGKLNAIHCDA